jgi:hypothetical protein
MIAVSKNGLKRKLQAESVGALAVIRSLGRAGYPVHAVSQDRDAIGMRSRFAIRPRRTEAHFTCAQSIVADSLFLNISISQPPDPVFEIMASAC